MQAGLRLGSDGQIGWGLPAILPDHCQRPVGRPTALANEGPDAIAKVGRDVHQERSRHSSESGKRGA